MKFTKFLTLTITLLFAGTFVVSSQTISEYEDFIKSGVKLSAKELVYQQLDLTPSEIADFDSVFDSYFEKRSVIAKERLPVMVEYASNASQMDDESLKEFNKYLIRSNKKLSSLNKKYYNKARKVISIKKATLFFLVEKYLRNEVEQQIIESVVEFSY